MKQTSGSQHVEHTHPKMQNHCNSLISLHVALTSWFSRLSINIQAKRLVEFIISIDLCQGSTDSEWILLLCMTWRSKKILFGYSVVELSEVTSI